MGGKKENTPLLRRYYTEMDFDHKQKRHKRHVDDEDEEDFQDDEDLKNLLAEDEKRGTSLILNDFFILFFYFIQLYCLLHAISLRWPWPEAWVVNGRYVLLFNMDVWEFMKLHNNETYRSVQGLYTASDLMPIKYWHVAAGWAGLLFLLFVVFIIVYCVIQYKRSPFQTIQLNRLQRAYIIIIQLLAIPFGTFVAKVYRCTDLNVVDVNNEIVCWQSEHFIHMGVNLVFFLLVFGVYPWWMITRTNREMVGASSDTYEGYIQLKETEYVKGLGIGWLAGKFHIFSSFRQQGAHYRASVHVVTGVLVIFYALLPNHMMIQAIMFTCTFLAMFIAYIIVRPFRVKAFNVFLITSVFVLMADGLLGAFVASFNSTSAQSPWLTPLYLTILLAVINVAWVIAFVCFILYLIIRGSSAWYRCNRGKSPMWPSMTEAGTMRKLTPETQKYVRAILMGRVLLEKCQSMPAMFAPAQELSRQIHIINAYYREALFLEDPLENSLWDILDELIMAYETIAPKSLFADSVKKSIKSTAAQFMKIMPSFVKRLNQREYDFILVAPVRKRLLLKMYCVSVLLGNRRKNQEKLRLTKPAIHRVWFPKEDMENDDGYYEDMYPGEEEAPSYVIRPTTAVVMDLLGNDPEVDDELALEEAEQFAKQHPVTPGTFINPAYQPDEVSVLLREDTMSVDLDNMMQGIPDAPQAPKLIDFEDDDEDDRPKSGLSQLGGQDPSVLALTPGDMDDDISSVYTPPLEGSDCSGPPAYSRPTSAQSARVSPRPGSATLSITGSRAQLGSVSGSQAGPGSVTGSRPTSAQSARLSPRPPSAQSGLVPPGTNSRPTSAQSNRGAGSRPTSAQHRPGSAQSNRGTSPRPGSAQGRPGSAGSKAQDDRSVSPLPGQIIDDESAV